MHILLTDHLTCPRCGPAFGLIVLADRIEDRRVQEGRLGCANCREEYPVSGGLADLRFPAGAPAASVPAGGTERVEEWPYRVAALLGASAGQGTVLLAGAGPAATAEVAALLPHLQVVGSGEERAPREGGATAGWLLHAERLPFRDRSLRGVALTAGASPGLLGEAARVLLPGARLVLDPAPADAETHLREHGLELLLSEGGVVVASKSGGG